MSKNKEQDQIVDVEIEDGSDFHMNQTYSAESPESPESQKQLVTVFKIKDEFIDDVQAAIGDLPYNTNVKVEFNSQTITMSLPDLMKMINDLKEEAEIGVVSFICEALTYFPYVRVYKILDQVKADQSHYFEEMEPKEVSRTEPV